MRKFCLRHTCLFLIILMLYTICSVYAYAAPGDIGIQLKFDKSGYFSGDTAVAELSLTGLSALDSSKDKIGSFEAYIKYNINDVVPMYDGVEVTDYDKPAGKFDLALDAANGKQGFNTAAKQMGYLDKDDRIIVVYFQEPNGVSLSGGSLAIGKINFKIKKTAGTVGVQIYTCAAYRPYTGTGGKEEVKGLPITIGSVTNASAALKTEASVTPISASYGEAAKEVNASVTVNTNVSATLIAQLYDKQSGLTKAVKINPVTYTSGTSEYQISVTFTNVTSKENLYVRYFLWTGTSGLKPVCVNKSTDVK